MPPSLPDLKTRLLRQYEQHLDRLLAQADVREELSLTEIEEMALAARAAVGKDITQALAESQATPSVPGPICPECQQEMHYKGRKKRRLITRSGEMEVVRGYYYCEHCRRGLFPPG
jgi:hypothetical protein